MLKLEYYEILAKQSLSKTEFKNELDLGLWLAKWYQRTYGIPFNNCLDMTLHELLIEYYSAPYIKTPELLLKEQEDKEKEEREKIDAEWARKIAAEQKEELDPKMQKLIEDKLNKIQPMEFGE